MLVIIKVLDAFRSARGTLLIGICDTEEARYRLTNVDVHPVINN